MLTVSSEVGARRVLVIDDEPIVLRATKRALGAIGVEVSTTTEPADALAILARDRHDVVVSDLQMQEDDGARVLARVARDAPHAVRILLSGDPELRPRFGRLEDARVHAVLGKSDIGALPELVVAHLDARYTTPATDDALTALARRFARAHARPRHEDDAHRERLAKLTSALAIAIGLSEAEVLDATLAATLHDVGQMTLPERVFAGSAPLCASDRAEIERHPEIGARIVSELPSLRRAAPIVGAHHARRDGRGYPRVDAAIPVAALVLHVVDAYDAMRCGRAWTPPRSHGATLEELERSAGTQLDADVVKAFTALDAIET